MEKAVLQHMHEDLEELKKSVGIIVHILSEEGQLTEEAKRQIDESRKRPVSEFKTQEEIEKKFL